MKARLSMAFEDLRGRDGNVVIAKGRSGLALRPYKGQRNPKTNAQTAVRANLTKAANTWKTFNLATATQWNTYAQTVTRTNPVSGQSYHPSGFNVFCGLATKFLQVNPGGAVPTTPPAAAFPGDNITILASAPSASGVIRFTANAANGANTKTEFLVQPLKNSNNTPSAEDYRSKGFWSFASGSLTKDVALPAGSYAVAYRFVNTATGQATAPVALAGVFTVTSASASASDSGSSSNSRKKAA